MIDIAFEIPDAMSDPFSITFGAVFCGPGDAELVIPGFCKDKTND